MFSPLWLSTRFVLIPGRFSPISLDCTMYINPSYKYVFYFPTLKKNSLVYCRLQNAKKSRKLDQAIDNFLLGHNGLDEKNMDIWNIKIKQLNNDSLVMYVNKKTTL